MKKTASKKAEAEAEMTTMRLSKPVKLVLKKLAEQEKRSLSNYISIVLTNHAREAGGLQTSDG